jgi:hypothetical protein
LSLAALIRLAESLTCRSIELASSALSWRGDWWSLEYS